MGKAKAPPPPEFEFKEVDRVDAESGKTIKVNITVPRKKETINWKELVK